MLIKSGPISLRTNCALSSSFYLNGLGIMLSSLHFFRIPQHLISITALKISFQNTHTHTHAHTRANSNAQRCLQNKNRKQKTKKKETSTETETLKKNMMKMYTRVKCCKIIFQKCFISPHGSRGAFELSTKFK